MEFWDVERLLRVDLLVVLVVVGEDRLPDVGLRAVEGLRVAVESVEVGFRVASSVVVLQFEVVESEGYDLDEQSSIAGIRTKGVHLRSSRLASLLRFP